MYKRVRIPRDFRRDHPYRALAAGVVLRALRDSEGNAIEGNDEAPSVDADNLRVWTQRAQWPTRLIEEALH